MEYRTPIIALTGGLASGKSKVAEFFVKHGGCEVVSSDAIARAVTRPGTEGYNKVVKEFGEGILQPAEVDAYGNKKLPEIDRKKLRDLVFNGGSGDKSRADKLGEILHPLIQSATQEVFASIRNKEFILWDCPLLVELNLDKFADEVIVIECDRSTRLMRALDRDASLTLKVATEIMNSQVADEDRRPVAKYIVLNDSTVTLRDLERKIARLHQLVMEGIVLRNRISYRKQRLAQLQQSQLLKDNPFDSNQNLFLDPNEDNSASIKIDKSKLTPTSVINEIE